MDRALDVYLHESLVGTLTQRETGQLAFAYRPEWLADARAVPLSRSLPLQPGDFDHRSTRPFFAGLLPEAEKRERIARAVGVSWESDFALLHAIGGECAGAVALWPAGEQPPSDLRDVPERPLSEHELIEILEMLPQRPLLAGHRGLRLSLAGAQDKLPVRVVEDRIALSLPEAPSTHIIKPGIPGFEDTVFNEAYCLRLATQVGIQAVEVRVQRAGSVPFLLIARYDRERDPNGQRRRLHQEDFCQALGLPPERKYEAEGGPSLEACFSLVRHWVTRPVMELPRLLDAMVFNTLVGNRDAHGKNFSLLYGAAGVGLAPLYDVNCTVVYPNLSSRLPMKIGGKYELDEVYPRHWERLAHAAELGPAMMRRRILELAGQMPRAARDVAATMRDEGIDSPVIARIAEQIEDAAESVSKRFDSATER